MQIIYNRRPVNHASFPLCVCAGQGMGSTTADLAKGSSN